MLAMPSANMRTNNNTNTTVNPIVEPEFKISSKDVEGLVLEIKENLRVSASTLKAIPCSHLSRKQSRASPYGVPGKMCTCNSTCNSTCMKKLRRKPVQEHNLQDDPYELLQRLINDGSLVTEAVRRVQLDLTPKQRYFYESD